MSRSLIGAQCAAVAWPGLSQVASRVGVGSHVAASRAMEERAGRPLLGHVDLAVHIISGQFGIARRVLEGRTADCAAICC